MTNKYQGRKYEVLPYDKNWVRLFGDEEKKIKEIFSDCVVGIEHVGSTSVSGMSGKPTIDILVLVNDISCGDAPISGMEKNGYVSRGEYIAVDSCSFAKEKDGHILFNVHIFKPEHNEAKKILLLRDFLRRNKDEADNYGSFKLQLFEKYSEDYGMYRKEKDKYMERLMTRAKIVKIIEPNNKILEKQKDYIRKLKETFPDELVEAAGSMAVPMIGRSEIDIMVIAGKSEPTLIADTLISWGYGKGPIIDGIAYFRKFEEDIEVGVQVLSPNHKMIAIHRKILEKLRTDEKLRNDYSKFKKTLNGLPEDDYKKQKGEWIMKNILK